MSVSTRPARVLTFVRLGRPLFLAAGFAMHGLGVAMALYTGASLNLAALLWGQVAITATQLMVHYSNDYFDLVADRMNKNATAWSGGSRVLPDGLLRPEVALRTALFFGAVAVAVDIAIAIFIQPGVLTLPILLLALILSWSYSGPPLRLHARGYGQIIGVIVVAALTPLTGYYLQAGQLNALPLLAVIPIACLQWAMLISVDIPDAPSDAKAGKRTLVVQIGTARAVYLTRLFLLGAYLVLPLVILAGLPLQVALAVALTAPLAIWQAERMDRLMRGRRASWNSLIFWNIALLMAATVAELLAFLWLWFV